MPSVGGEAVDGLVSVLIHKSLHCPVVIPQPRMLRTRQVPDLPGVEALERVVGNVKSLRFLEVFWGNIGLKAVTDLATIQRAEENCIPLRISCFHGELLRCTGYDM